jgi:hypothetical protein
MTKPKLTWNECLYSYGYASRDDALCAVDGLYASGEVSPAERPRIVTYVTAANEPRYGIALRDNSLELA